MCPDVWEIVYDDGEVRGTIRAHDAEEAAAEYVRLHHVDFDYDSHIDIKVRKQGTTEIVDLEVEVVPEPVCTARRKK